MSIHYSTFPPVSDNIYMPIYIGVRKPVEKWNGFYTLKYINKQSK